MLTLFVSAFIMNSCNSSENSESRVNESEKTKTEQSEVEQSKPVKTEVNQVEIDAKRMAELSCLAQNNITEGQKAGLTRAETNIKNDPLNAEMTEISQRFEEEYANNKRKEEFQIILQEELKKCNNHSF